MSSQLAERAAVGASPAGAGDAPTTGRMDRRAVDEGAGGMWAWLFQRVTAVVLIIGLATHLIATHIFGLGHLSYLNIGHRLSSDAFRAVDISLLAAALFHGLNGARMVVLDYWLASRASRRVLSVALWVFGTATFVYGMWALWPWISH
jgi:succinate dehydrogenase hydrophobic anchor subunit